MTNSIRQSDLEAYLDEALPAAEMSAIEDALRNNSELSAQLIQINSRRDAGVHTVGEIWRRHRISCPSRDELGSFLLEILEDDHTQYIQFHLNEVGCRLCQANLFDLKAQQEDSADDVTVRRKKYFQSSIGQLRTE
ncbi:MAG: hypothetical protein COA78_01770 [Blastopirellula sp.]|nr:MAG: hypothetical protein COA78_01770 [Blastopirellula sp.]